MIKLEPFTEKFFAPVDGHFLFENGLSYAYPDGFWEGHDCFRAKIKAFPIGCWALTAPKLIGYAFGHPWISSSIVHLNEIISLPSVCDCFYIHDVAIVPSRRGQGFGKILVQKMLEVAKGYRTIKLVSVLNSVDFWKKFGFVCVEEIDYNGNMGWVMVKND